MWRFALVAAIIGSIFALDYLGETGAAILAFLDANRVGVIVFAVMLGGILWPNRYDHIFKRKP
ncbi:MAG: hypothetical protein QNJ62_05215 [Methyloceanibacter sp.]|nr:hypothetical protein [Methyloceanibacter sp.]